MLSWFCRINLSQTLTLFLKIMIFKSVIRRRLSPCDKTKAAVFEAHYLLTTLNCVRTFYCEAYDTLVQAQAITFSASPLCTQGLWKSTRINVWLDGESKAHFSFLTTSSVGLWLCHPDLRPQNKSSSDVFLILTSDRVLWWSVLLKPGQQPAKW